MPRCEYRFDHQTHTPGCQVEALLSRYPANTVSRPWAELADDLDVYVEELRAALTNASSSELVALATRIESTDGYARHIRASITRESHG